MRDLTFFDHCRFQPQETNRAQKFTGDDSEAQRLKKSREWEDLVQPEVQPGSTWCQSWCKIAYCCPQCCRSRWTSYIFVSAPESMRLWWDCGFNLGWFGMWVWSAMEASMFRLICSACSAITPQERLLKFYGSVRAERVSAEASQSNSFLRMFPFFLISPNFCKTKSLCSYQISVTLCFFRIPHLFQDCSLEQMEVENEIGKIHNSQVVAFSDLMSHRHQKSIKS